MAGAEKVDFERITRVYREESGKKPLVELEKDFYDAANMYIDRLTQEAAKAMSQDPNAPKTQFLQDELRKAKKRIEQIYQYRERKIALLAQSKVSGVDVEVRGLAAQENLLFDSLVETLRAARKTVFEGGKMPETPATQTPSEPKEAEAKPIPEQPKAAPPQRKLVTVYITDDVPPFAGIDVTYRLKKEDVVSLPEEYGSVLVKRGKARYVDVS